METFRELFAKVVKELNSDFNTLQNANKILALYNKKYIYPKNQYSVGDFITVSGRVGTRRIGEFTCVFGTYESENHKLTKKRKKIFYKLYSSKCGIEVLGMLPERTKDGKYAYKGISIKDLKESCKMNGIKGVSKMDKCELVKVLMNC